MPYVRKDRSIVRVLVRETVNLLTEPGIVVGFGLDEIVERVGDEAVANNHHPTLHTLLRCPLAVSKSMAAKFCMIIPFMNILKTFHFCIQSISNVSSKITSWRMW